MAIITTSIVRNKVVGLVGRYHRHHMPGAKPRTVCNSIPGQGSDDSRKPKKIVFPTVYAIIRLGELKEKIVRFMLVTSCERTMIREEIATELGLKAASRWEKMNPAGFYAAEIEKGSFR